VDHSVSLLLMLTANERTSGFRSLRGFAKSFLFFKLPMFDLGKGLAATGQLATVSTEQMGAISFSLQRSAMRWQWATTCYIDSG